MTPEGTAEGMFRMRNKSGRGGASWTAQEPAAQNEKSSPEGSLLNKRSIDLVLARVTIARIQLLAAIMMVLVALNLNEREQTHASHKDRK